MSELGRMLREDGIEEGIEKGIERGIEKGKVEMIRELLKEGLLTKEQISKTSKLPLEKIHEIEKELMALK